jgi:hypothetical protein
MPAHRKQRRRVIDHLQAFRIAGLANGDKRNAEFSRGVDLTLGRVARTDLRRRCTATPRQRGQGLKRSTGTAEMIDEGAKRARPRPSGAFATNGLFYTPLGTGGGSPITTLHISHIGCKRRRSAALLASSRESRKRQGDPLSKGTLPRQWPGSPTTSDRALRRRE